MPEQERGRPAAVDTGGDGRVRRMGFGAQTLAGLRAADPDGRGPPGPVGWHPSGGGEC